MARVPLNAFISRTRTRRVKVPLARDSYLVNATKESTVDLDDAPNAPLKVHATSKRHLAETGVRDARNGNDRAELGTAKGYNGARVCSKHERELVGAELSPLNFA